MADIVMPRLSDTMEEGTILRWLKRDGEPLARGEELVEIETDKATMTYESDQDGVLAILAAEGETLAVGELIARVGVSGGAGAAAHGAATGGQAEGEPSLQPPRGERAPAAVGAAGDGLRGAPSAAAGLAGRPEVADAEGGRRVKASPLARRIARESGVDLRTLAGSGPGGRIVRADVLAHEHAVAEAGAPASAGAPPTPVSEASLEERVATAKGETTIVELNRTQQTIARRMSESKATIPDFTLQAEVDMEECVRLRGELKRLSRPGASAEPGAGAPEVPTYNDMIVKASALALREHPRANGSYKDGHLELHGRINVGVAVAAHDALIVPTVFDADEKSLGEIARETRALAERGHDHPSGARRRHLHGLEPRHVRRAELQRDHQPAAGRDPVRRLTGAPRGRARGRARLREHDGAHARLRPPRPLRRRRRRAARPHSRAARAAGCAHAVRTADGHRRAARLGAVR
jgi:pyruvate dehydrogenase E2 component (dihydrolipoamide acetyltransferase)